MADLFGFNCNNLSFDTNVVSTLDNDGTLFGALISRKIEPLSKLYNSATLFRLSMPSINKTPSIFSNDNLNERKSKKNSYCDESETSKGAKCNVISNVRPFLDKSINRKFISECNKEELSIFLRLKFSTYEKITGLDFIKQSFNALLGFSSETYSVDFTDSSQVGKFQNGTINKSVYQFYQEIQFTFLIQVYLEKLVTFCFSKWKDFSNSGLTIYSEIGNAVETMLFMYKSSMSSLIVAINYKSMYELNSILVWTSTLRRYLLLIFQIVASDDLKSCTLMHLTGKSNASFDAFQCAVISILTENAFSNSLPDFWRTCSELVNTSYLLCHKDEYRFYSCNACLQYKDMSFERGRLLISRFFFKCVSHSFLFKLRESLFQFQHHPELLALNKSVLFDVSQEQNESSCLYRIQHYADWISTHLQLYMNKQTRLKMFSAFNTTTTTTGSTSGRDEHVNTFSVSKHLRGLCYDGEISLFIPFTDIDASTLNNSTCTVKTKVEKIKAIMKTLFDNRNDSSLHIFDKSNRGCRSHASASAVGRRVRETATAIATAAVVIKPCCTDSDSSEILVNNIVVSPETVQVKLQAVVEEEVHPSESNDMTTHSESAHAVDISDRPRHHSITNIVGYEKFVSSDSFELAKSSILIKYMDLMSSVDKRRNELMWRRKRATSLCTCREKLIEQRFEDISSWKKLLLHVQPLTTVHMPVVTPVEASMITGIPSSQQDNKVLNIALADDSASQSLVTGIQDKDSSPLHDTNMDDNFASINLKSDDRRYDNGEVVLLTADSTEVVGAPSPQSAAGAVMMGELYLHPNPPDAATETRARDGITNDNHNAIHDDSIDDATTATANDSSVTTRLPQPVGNPTIIPAPRANKEANQNPKLQQVEAFQSFLFASAQILDKDRHKDVERSEAMFARINASFNQSLVVLAEQENLCSGEGEEDPLLETVEGSVGGVVNASLNPSLMFMIESSLIPLLHWQCKLFDAAVLLSILEESNGNLMGHLDFIYDTFLLSQTSTFMKLFVDCLLSSASCYNSNSAISSTSPSASLYSRTHKRELTTPWTSELLSISLLQTTKLMDSTHNHLKSIPYLSKVKMSTTTPTAETNNDSSNSRNWDYFMLSIKNLENVRIHMTTDFPISMLVSEQTQLVISYATRRIMEMMQLVHSINVTWQDLRESTACSSLHRRRPLPYPSRRNVSNKTLSSSSLLSHNYSSANVSIVSDDVAIRMRNLNRSRSYAFLLVQQTVQSIFSFVWDRVNSSQRGLEEVLRRYDSSGADSSRSSVEEIAAIIQNGFVDILLSCFIEVKDSDSESILQDSSQVYNNLLRRRVSMILVHILDVCRRLLRCIGDHFRLSSMSATPAEFSSTQQSVQEQAHEITKLLNELLRNKSELVSELKMLQNHDTNAFLVFLGAD